MRAIATFAGLIALVALVLPAPTPAPPAQTTQRDVARGPAAAWLIGPDGERAPQATAGSALARRPIG